MQYRLRYLLILVAIAPPLLWVAYLTFMLVEETFLRGLGPSKSTIEKLQQLHSQEVGDRQGEGGQKGISPITRGAFP
jgi:hypothetical protein